MIMKGCRHYLWVICGIWVSFVLAEERYWGRYTYYYSEKFWNTAIFCQLALLVDLLSLEQVEEQKLMTWHGCWDIEITCNTLLLCHLLTSATEKCYFRDDQESENFWQRVFYFYFFRPSYGKRDRTRSIKEIHSVGCGDLQIILAGTLTRFLWKSETKTWMIIHLDSVLRILV